MLTRKLYDDDSYCKEFTATVLSCEKSDIYYKITLDRTAFFPEGGGQYSDTGVLCNAKVLDVQIDNGIIYHYCDKPLNIGNTVSGRINFTERFDKMQQHSGEHIISGIVHKLYGYNNTGFHLSENIVTLDFDGMLNRDQLNEIETLANEAVQKNVCITAEYPSIEKLKVTEYRSKLDLTENVRLVTIDGYDICACCAPHVKNTGEIGVIKLLESEKHRSGIRITIKCGMRAILDYRSKQTSISKISATLKVPQSDTAEAVCALLADNDRLKYEIIGIKRKLCEIKLSTMKPTNKNLILVEENMDISSLRYIADKGTEKCNIFVALCFIEDSYNFVCCSKKIDLTQILPDLKQKLGFVGGGSSTMLQGKITADIKTTEIFFDNN